MGVNKPVFTEEFHWMLRPDRSVATAKIVGGAELPSLTVEYRICFDRTIFSIDKTPTAR
jgi:hypothetical protein